MRGGLGMKGLLERVQDIRNEIRDLFLWFLRVSLLRRVLVVFWLDLALGRLFD